MNARTGKQLDFIQRDDDRHLPLDMSYIIDSNISLRERESEDMKVDERGKQLLDLCISARLRILNGRCTGDSYGKFTCQKPTGASVVDYAILSEELLQEIIYFHIHPFKPTFSDCHSKISLNLKAAYTKCAPQNLTENMPLPFKWTKCSPEMFQKALICPSISRKIESFLNNTFSSNE